MAFWPVVLALERLHRNFRSARWFGFFRTMPALPAPNMTAITWSTRAGPCSPSGRVSMDGDRMSNSINAITTEAAPKPFGHYAQATEAGGVVYVSGQLAARADGTSLANESFEVQARQALANVIAIVEGAGLDRDR